MSAERVGPYTLSALLGRGGMAELSRATGPLTDRGTGVVVIKRLFPELSEVASARQMFAHEGRVLAAMDHPNLRRVLALALEANPPYLVLEYVDGCTIADLVRHLRRSGTKMQAGLAVWIGRELCRGLDHVHSRSDPSGRPLNAVHRDVTPANILASTNGEVKLGDFGVASSALSEVRTTSGQVKGTPRYLSPEQLAGDRAGPLSDVYGVGLVLFELLTGEPFREDAAVREALQGRPAQGRRGRSRSLAELCPKVPTPLVRLVERALRDEPETRPASASAMAAALTEVLEGMAPFPDATDLAALVRAAGRSPDSRRLDSVPLVEAVAAATAATPPAQPDPDTETRTAPRLDTARRSALRAIRDGTAVPDLSDEET